jgi:TonB family protein
MLHASESIPVGHVVVHLESDSHPREVEFLFERQQSRVGGAVGASLFTHVAAIVLFVLALKYGSRPYTSGLLQPDLINQQIVWLAEPGPGGGGGGGGNRSPEPPRKAEIPGKDKITVPVVETPKLENVLTQLEKEPPQQFDIPAKTLAADLSAIIPGVIDGTVLSPSQGSGSGGGGGTGTGSGIGSGVGSGLGPGYGGGTGGGAYRPGNGVDAPRLLRKVDPQYTPDAMRAKVQGTVEIECIVQPNGTCSNIGVVRSLDPVFGLDREAIKAVQQWRFVPGRRQGQEVPVIVTIELTFTLR